MSGLRFCMLTTFYPPYSFGGDAIGIQRLSRALVRNGHEVTVVHDVDAYDVLRRTPLPRDVPDDDEGVRVVRLRSRVPMLSALAVHQLGRPLLKGPGIRRLLREGRFDVVNFHNVSLIGGPGLLERQPSAVTLYMAHEHWLVCPTSVLWRHRRERCTGKECFRCALRYHRPPQLWRTSGLLERCSANVDAFIAMSEFSRDKHREFGFTRPMDVMPYFLPDPPSGGVPAPASSSPHERPYFFFAGRLERIKGLDDVIPAFADFPQADLLIAGDGDYAPTLRALAASRPNVRLLGRVPVDELPRYYQHAVATLVPSVCFETFGIVVIESFQQGTPVIARRVGPLPEIVNAAGAGYLFESRDELLSAMRRLVEDASHRRDLSQRAYRGYLERWSESAVIPQYLSIIHRVAEARGLHRVAGALHQQEVS